MKKIETTGNMNTNQHRVHASQAGAKLDSHVLTCGGTDDTVALQAVLDEAPKLGRLHLILDGAALLRGLNVATGRQCSPPGTTIGLPLCRRSFMQNP